MNAAEALRIPLSLEERTAGNLRLEQFTVDKHDAMFSALRMGQRGVPPGVYWRLFEGRTMWMSDTPAERGDARPLMRNARGSVLINGLGLGFTLWACLHLDGVSSVCVVEKSQDIIDMIGPFYDDARVRLICDDALTIKWPRNTHFDSVWHDIWPDLCTDQLGDVATLKRRYARRCNWQAAWCEEELRYQRRLEKREAAGWGCFR